MEPLTFAFTILNILFLFSQFMTYISQGQKSRHKRFLVLLLVFFFYNFTNGLVPDDRYPIPITLQLVISTSAGITLGIFLYNYLTKELDLQLGFYTTRRLALTLFGSFLCTYVIIIFLTDDPDFARLTFIIFPAAIGISFAYHAIKNILKQKFNANNPPPALYQIMAYTSYISLLGLCIFPIAFGLGDDQVIEATILNIVLAVNMITNTYREIHHAKAQEHLVKGDASLNGTKYITTDLSDILSARELEICYLLFESEETYESIGEQMFISPKTVSKHASNIFKKTDTKNRIDFLDKYRIETNT